MNNKRSSKTRYMEELDFRLGYDAAASYDDFNDLASEDWQDGWNAYQDDMDSQDQKSW